MNRIFAASAALALIAAPFAAAQEKGAIVVSQTEAVVKVVRWDRVARTVTLRGPRNEVTLKVPKEAQNLDQVKVGSTFRVRYTEAVAVALLRGGTASATADRQVRLAPKGGTPGGVVVDTVTLSATIEAIDYANREIAVRGPKGNVLALKVADEVQGLDQVGVGDRITLAYAEGLAMEMLPYVRPGPKAAPTPK